MSRKALKVVWNTRHSIWQGTFCVAKNQRAVFRVNEVLTSFFIGGCSSAFDVTPVLFMNELATIDEKLPPSLRFFLFITIVGLMFGGFFFVSLCSLKAQRKKELEEFSQKEHDIFM